MRKIGYILISLTLLSGCKEEVLPGENAGNSNIVDIEMVQVEGGTFTMLPQESTEESESAVSVPDGPVTLASYYIGKYEVTQGQWVAVMGRNPMYFSGNNFPMNNVSWTDTREFIKRLNKLTGKKYRLPTEAEWEFAARGGNHSKNYLYSGSNTLKDVAWYNYNSESRINEVGTKQANELGIYDMSGNVREWCSDRMYKDNHRFESKHMRKMRGSCFTDWIENSQINKTTNYHDPNHASSEYGFRLVLESMDKTPDDEIRVQTGEVVEITEKSFTVKGSVNHLELASEIGIMYGTSPENIFNSSMNQISGPDKENGEMTFTFSEALTNQDYYYCIYARDGWNIITGEIKSLRTNLVEIPMVFVKGGTFFMGGSYNNVYPQHIVTVSDFYIGKYEIPTKIYCAVTGRYYGGWSEESNYPASPISDDDIILFIEKLNNTTGLKYRLPTEAEWEFAAKGGTESKGYMYSGSNNPDDVAWYYENSKGSQSEIGTKLPNELGIYDMSGNVKELCSDWFGPYTSEEQWNPTGPPSGNERVVRGGCSYDEKYKIDVLYREEYTGWDRIGVRLVLEPNK